MGYMGWFVAKFVFTILNICVATIPISAVLTGINSLVSDTRITNKGYNIKSSCDFTLWDNVKYYAKNYGRVFLPFSNLKMSVKNIFRRPSKFDSERISFMREAGRIEDPKPEKKAEEVKKIEPKVEEPEKEEPKKLEPKKEMPKMFKKVEEMTASEKKEYYKKKYYEAVAKHKVAKTVAEKNALCDLMDIYIDGYKAADAEIKRMAKMEEIAARKEELSDVPKLEL